MSEEKSLYTVNREFSFEAAHQLPGHPTCGDMHGHSFHGEISVSANSLTSDGFIIEFGALKKITSLYDHGSVITLTAEQLAEEIGRAVLEELSRQENFGSIVEVAVVLWETENSRAEWVWHVPDKRDI